MLIPYKREQERLDVMHHMFVRTMGGRLWLAPIDEDKIHNVLDIGTGTGIRTLLSSAMCSFLTPYSCHRDCGRSTRRTGKVTHATSNAMHYRVARIAS